MHHAVQQSQFCYLNGCSTPVLSRLSFTRSQPFTVSLAFGLDEGEWVEWEFARELLIIGMREPAGIGDVRIRPDLWPDEDVMVLELESPDGYAVVEMDRAELWRFLKSTIDLVPPGAESNYLDLDAVIAGLITA